MRGTVVLYGVWGLGLTTAIEVHDLWKRFGEKTVLKAVNLKVERGKSVSLLGPNGAGKTTLIEIIVGILSPSSGSISIMGKESKDEASRMIIGYCPQEEGLFFELTGMENIMFYAGLYGLDPKRGEERAKELLEWMGLWDERKKKVSKYSGGMRKRLSLAISLIHDPPVLILDEPTVGLDPEARREIWHFIEKIKDSGKTVLMTTHYTEEAEILSDYVYIMDEGKIIAEGDPEDLKRKYVPESVIKLELAKPPMEDIEDIAGKIGLRSVKQDRFYSIYSIEPEKDVPRIVAEIHGKGGVVESLKVEKPSLEDVFIKLTNKRLRE